MEWQDSVPLGERVLRQQATEWLTSPEGLTPRRVCGPVDCPMGRRFARHTQSSCGLHR